MKRLDKIDCKVHSKNNHNILELLFSFMWLIILKYAKYKNKLLNLFLFICIIKFVKWIIKNCEWESTYHVVFREKRSWTASLFKQIDIEVHSGVLAMKIYSSS